jgi:hypothetical protein
VKETLVLVEAPRFTAGLVLHDNVVIKTAPIARYMVGWSLDKLRKHCERKQWKIKMVGDRWTKE